ncbi:MAG: hypothetical protein ABJO88_00055 [Parasphingorhabdus sp.]
MSTVSAAGILYLAGEFRRWFEGQPCDGISGLMWQCAEGKRNPQGTRRRVASVTLSA